MSMQNRTYTSFLLNYVEPTLISGVLKTTFYTELNTNVNVGDKVYILNGNYDNNSIYGADRYSNGSDGYTVLAIDKCKVTLDINYTGSLPYNTDEYENFIKVHHIRSQREFDYINKQYVNTYPTFKYNKFELNYTNNIIYADSAYSDTASGLLGENTGVTQSGFYGFRSNYTSPTHSCDWINITSYFNSNSLTFSTDYYAYGLTNNGKVYIVGEDINIGSQNLKQRTVYKYVSGNWIIDMKYKKPILSKSIFRNGTFNGTFNDGIFGTNDNRITWSGGSWNSGFMVNARIASGILNSKSSINEQSFYSTLDSNGLPVNSTDFLNNQGFGYNYIVDSDIVSATISNGNFYNCNIGLTTSATFSAVENYINATSSFPINVFSGFYNFCDVNSAILNNSKTYNTIIRNSSLLNSKIINTQIYDSIAYASNMGDNSGENGIKVLKADINSYVSHNFGQYTTNSSAVRGVLKLYISPEDYLNIDNFDIFYITQINKNYVLNSINNDQKILLPYETKFIFDSFLNSDFSNQCFAMKSDISENLYKYSATFTASLYTNYATNSTIKNLPSIDVDLGSNLAYYYTGMLSSPTTNYFTNSVINNSNVNLLFTDTVVNTSDFRSGIFDNSKWISGGHVNDFSNIIALTNSYPYLVSSGTNSLTIRLSATISTINDGSLDINKIISLDSIDFITNTQSVSLGGFYKITGNTASTSSTILTVRDYNSNTLASINGLSGTFSAGTQKPNYVSVSRFLINSSEINAGLFKRTTMRNTNINAINFDNTDRTLNLDNINKLRLVNLIFKDTNNTVNSGLIYKSHIYNGSWNNGILFNSVWCNNSFNNGIFKDGFWIDGTFNNGVFMDSNGTTASTLTYNNTNLYNNWLNGTFSNGEFTTSVWVNGTFNYGKFYRSDWYCGVWNDGILGDKSIPYTTTTLASLAPLYLASGATQTLWYNGNVENAKVGGRGTIQWYNGKFNSGEFTTDAFSASIMSVTPSSTWYDGFFNNSIFGGNSKWKGGTFSNSKFTSYYGWTYSGSNTASYYSWENGVFLSGQFGQPSYTTNSTWFTGQFRGGIFNGRYWNNGILTNGQFNGGITISATNSEAFINSYTSSYYGMWKDGWVIDTISVARPMDKIYTNIIRSKNKKEESPNVKFNNMLWINGTFSHNNGIVNNSLWLSGAFNNGVFKSSVFNPYVDRTITATTASASFDLTDNCMWNNGVFDGGEFYISEWKNGLWKDGTMSGAIWNNGVWNYGNANNIYWIDGQWRNGNWDGSPFDYNLVTGSYYMKPGKEHDMILRVAQFRGTNSVHLINAFSGTQSVELLKDPDVDYNYIGWTYSHTGANSIWTPSAGYAYSTSMMSIFVSDNSLVTTGGGGVYSDILKAIGTMSGTTNIFTDLNQKYNVSLTFLVENATASIQINAGAYVTQSILGILPPYSIISGGGGTTIYPPSIHTINFVYQPIYATVSQELTIQKLAYGVYSNNVYLLNGSVVEDNVKYDPNYNNNLYASLPVSATYGSIVSFPSSLVLSTIASGNSITTNYTVGLRFGNGLFNSGIWENGVWNNGWRYDYNMLQFHTLTQYLKINSQKWRIQITNTDSNFSDSMKNYLSVGDKVIVGNVVMIDINENRKLLKTYSTVIYVGDNFIVIEILTNFPIRRIEMDSPNHIMYVTKNIWLSGAFLNGYYKGVWSYGLFKGYPYITRMSDTQMLDGIFDGGRFDSLLGTYSDATNFGFTTSYHTGLVQNFTFKDNNIAPPFALLYNSWMDINWDNSSMTNIGQNFTNFDISTNTEYINSNLNGYPTVDVLSSDSWFRDGYRRNISRYSLGTKFKRYVDMIGANNSQFLDYFSEISQTNFLADGWTYSTYTNSPLYGATFSSIYYQEPGNPAGILSFSASFNRLLSAASVTTFNKSILNNISTNEILNNRYSTVEFGLLSFYTLLDGVTVSGATGATGIYGPTSYPGIYFDNTPATYSAVRYPINHLADFQYTGNTNRIEYFYNRQALNMDLTLIADIPGGSTNTTKLLRFDYINFYEVDMIPFFMYATESRINQAICVPLKGYAPKIDYSNTSFNFIGNISLTTDATTHYLAPPPGPSPIYTTAIYTDSVFTTGGLISGGGGGLPAF